MIDQSTPGSTIDITARIATERGSSDQISTVSGPPFVKLCLKIKRGCMYLLSLRVAIRQQMATAAAASSRNCTVSVRAVLDKRGSKRRVAQRHHTNAPVTFFRARRRSVSFLPHHSQTASSRAARVRQSKELTLGEAERSLRSGGSRELGKPF